MVEEHIVFKVRLPGWIEDGELRLAVWEGPDGKPEQQRWLSERDVFFCQPTGDRWKGYNLYEVEVCVPLSVLHEFNLNEDSALAYSIAAGAFYTSVIAELRRREKNDH